MEPHVDALQVEAMVALGEQPGLLPVGELAETNRALKPLLELRRSEGDNGEGMENGDVESPAGGCSSGVVVLVKHEAPAAAARVAVPAPEPLGVEVEDDDEDDGDEENDDGRHHHLPCP